MAEMVDPMDVEDDEIRDSSPPARAEVEVCILKFGEVYEYTIPSFSVITVTLRHAEVQLVDKNDDVILKNVFVRDHPTLGVPLPLKMKVTEGCLVEVS